MAYSSAVALTVYDVIRAGTLAQKNMVTPTATHGNKVLNDGKTFLYVINGSGAPIDVTINTPGTVDGVSIADLVVSVAATGDAGGADKKFIGPFTGIFNQTDGYIWAVCSAVTTVTMGAFRLANP
jgi:hypothetical protein